MTVNSELTETTNFILMSSHKDVIDPSNDDRKFAVFKVENTKHPKCKGYRQDFDPYDYDCGYSTTIDCSECKYGVGRKDPEAKCNREPN